MEQEPANSRSIAIDVRELTKAFGTFLAVDRLTLRVGTGEVFAFLGANGSGKTTTIRMLCGIFTPSSGTGNILGFDLLTEGESIKRNIGYMSQRFALYEDLTVRENLEFYAGVYGVSGERRRKRIAELISMADLTGRESTLAAHLSGGWKQRLALGCAILHEPPLLFLDEPTAGVDPVSRRGFWTLIYSLARGGTTIFLTTHYLDEAEHADRVALMVHGKVIALASPHTLRTRGLVGTLLEVHCEPVMDALLVIPTWRGVREVTLYGAAMHVLIDESEMNLDQLRSALKAAHFTVGEIRLIEPTLEDVFVSLIRPRGN